MNAPRIHWVRELFFSAGKKERTGWGWGWTLDGFIWDAEAGEWKGVFASVGSSPSREAARNKSRMVRQRGEREWRQTWAEEHAA